MTTTPQHEAATAARMVKSYGSADRAADAAGDHAMSHERGTHARAFWDRVRAAIIQADRERRREARS